MIQAQPKKTHSTASIESSSPKTRLDVTHRAHDHRRCAKPGVEEAHPFARNFGA
jgi:hypothetical protein